MTATHKIVAALVVVVACVLIGALADAQSPTSSARPHRSERSKQREARKDRKRPAEVPPDRATPSSPHVLDASLANNASVEKQSSPTLDVSIEKEQPGEEAKQPSPEPGYWKQAFGPTEVSNWIGLCVGIIAILAAVRTLRRMGEQNDIALRSVKHLEAVERAYVTISHTPFKVVRYEKGAVWFEVEVKNWGATPADVIGGIIAVEMQPDGSAPPKTIPTASYQRIPPVFLVPTGHITVRSMVWGFSDEDIAGAFEPATLADPPRREMWLVGFVVYRDRFGNEHCGGYGRHWDGEDLVFDATTEALNYDRSPTEREKELALRRVN